MGYIVSIDADKMGSTVDPDPKEQSDFCPVLSV